MSFGQVVGGYDIPRSHLIGYLQVRGFVKKHFDSFPVLQSVGWLDEWLEGEPDQKGMVSLIYMKWHPHHWIISGSPGVRIWDLKFLMTFGNWQLK